MRIFIHNVDTFHGKVIVEELRKLGGQNNRIFGTAGNPDEAPKAVKRILTREDPKRAKKMQETIFSCGLVVLDLFNCSVEDLHFAISALGVDPNTKTPRGEAPEKEVVFVLVSSVMVWADTKLDRDGPLTDKDFLQRVPKAGSRYEQWKDHEDLVMNCFNREGSLVKGFVVAGGTLYGKGEDTLSPLFSDAWRGLHERKVIAPGTNLLPTVHVRDMSRLVRQIAFNGSEIVAAEKPFFIAVDQPPPPPGEEPPPPPPAAEAAEGEEENAEPPLKPVVFSKPSTQQEICQGIVDEFCDKYDVPIVASTDAESADDELLMLQEKLTLDLWIQPSDIMMEPAFAEECNPPGWFCKDGIIANMRKIAKEFTEERKLRELRVVIAGPPASGKSTLAKAVADHFRIPHLELTENTMAAMAEKLSSTVCRYRGYVLDARCLGFADVDKLFREEREVPPDPDADPPPELEEGEEPPPPVMERVLRNEITPAFVIVTQAPPDLCRARWRNKGEGSLEQFEATMAQYTNTNLGDDVGSGSLSDFFQDIAKIGVMNLPIAGRDEEDMFESTRIYMENAGRPFNYLPTAEEVGSEILSRRMQREDEAAAAAAEQANRLRMESDGEQKEMQSHAKRLQIINEHEQQRRELAEVPLREYLMTYMVPCLTEGLIEICKVVPDNPTGYLADYLEEHAKDGDPASV